MSRKPDHSPGMPGAAGWGAVGGCRGGSSCCWATSAVVAQGQGQSSTAQE